MQLFCGSIVVNGLKELIPRCPSFGDTGRSQWWGHLGFGEFDFVEGARCGRERAAENRRIWVRWQSQAYRKYRFCLLIIFSILVANPLTLLSSAFDLTIYPPSMPCNSLAQTTNEPMEMSTYDAAPRTPSLRSSSSSGFVPDISEFLLRLLCGDHYPRQSRRVEMKRCMKTPRRIEKYNEFLKKSTKLS